MPFLRASEKKQKKNTSPAVVTVQTDKQSIGVVDTSASCTARKTTIQKGKDYEEYVGSIYEKNGYSVDYNGIKKGSHDGGIDLICKYGRYTEVVQCKCYSGGNIGRKDIYQFCGAFRHYAAKHQQEVVSGAFWTTLSIKTSSDVFSAAKELGIMLYHGRKPPEPEQK